MDATQIFSQLALRDTRIVLQCRHCGAEYARPDANVVVAQLITHMRLKHAQCRGCVTLLKRT